MLSLAIYYDTSRAVLTFCRKWPQKQMSLLSLQNGEGIAMSANKAWTAVNMRATTVAVSFYSKPAFWYYSCVCVWKEGTANVS